jgi:transposase
MNHALMLVGWDVTDVKITGNVQHATANYRGMLDTCPKCGSVGRLYRHGTKTVEYRDAPAFGKQFVIRCKVQRFRCRDCNETSMQTLPDMDNRRQMTQRCVQYVEQQGIPKTFTEIARDIGVTEKTIRGVCTAYFQREMENYKFETPIALGIDELKLDGKMRAIFMDLGTGRPLDIIPSHHKWDVARWLSQLKGRERVNVVTIDMTGHYKDVIGGNLPNATVIIDKFHVLRYADDALKRVRAKARSKAAGGTGKNPRRNVTLLRKRAHRLNAAQEFELDGILLNSPIVAAGYRAKESFHDIWNAPNRDEAERLFAEWAAAIPPEVKREFGKVARMVERWHAPIFAHFDYRATNAVTENRNGLIKMLNRDGRGYTFDIIRAKALLTKPLTDGPLRECKYCKGQYPAKSFRKMPTHLLEPPGNSKFDKAYRHALSQMEESCINCHFSIQRVRVPGPMGPPDPDSVFIPALEFWTTPLDRIIEKYGSKFHTESLPDEMFN